MLLKLSPSEIEILRKLQRNLAGSSDYARVTCLLMLGMGNSPSLVSSCLGVDTSTVYRYRSMYLHGGESELLENRHKGYWGILDSRRLAALRNELCEHVYTDAESFAAWIKAFLGVEYTSQGVVDLLNRIGFTYKKTTEFPCGAEASLQAAFAEELTNLLSSMGEGTRIKQIFLSPYSSNLNLIERLWKFLRKKVINRGFYRTKEEFRTAIKRFFDNIHIFKEELGPLLTLNFRLVNSQSISF